MEVTDLINKLIASLNLDDDAETTETITDIVNECIPVIIAGINDSLNYDYLKNDMIFIKAVKTLATQTYYERTLPDSYSKGLVAMMMLLKGKYEGVVLNEENNE